MSQLDLGSTEAPDPPTDERLHKRGRGCLPALVALVLLVGAGIFVYVKGVEFVKDALPGSAPGDYAGVGKGSVVIEVQEGETATDIAATLHKADVIKSVEAFTTVAAENERSRRIQVGFYELRKKMAAETALKLLLDPKSMERDILTIPEGLRATEIVKLIVDKTDFDQAEVQAAYADRAALGLPSYAKGKVEGYLFPSTYDVTPDLDAAGLLKVMVDEFTKHADELGLESGAKELGMTPAEVVTIASLVQAEASRTEDMPGVASVVYNRLGDGMALQFDSTLHYAEGTRGDIVAGEDLREIDSPFNTYQLTGLPPTPIDSPGTEALEAALNPADSEYLYFVTVNLKTGETKFAEDYGEHLGNVAEYREYCTTSDAC